MAGYGQGYYGQGNYGIGQVMSSTVFNNADGANFPEGSTEIGWTTQGVQLNPQTKPAHVFTFATNFTPSTRPGWTVQSAVDGSDQSLTGHIGV